MLGKVRVDATSGRSHRRPGFLNVALSYVDSTVSLEELRAFNIARNEQRLADLGLGQSLDPAAARRQRKEAQRAEAEQKRQRRLERAAAAERKRNTWDLERRREALCAINVAVEGGPVSYTHLTLPTKA